MAALVVDGPAVVALSAALDDIAYAASSAYNLPVDIGLHGYEIFQGKNAWASVPPRARIGVFDDVTEAIAGQDAAVIARALDIHGHTRRYLNPTAPHSVVLQHLLERIDEHVVAHGEYALVSADE